MFGLVGQRMLAHEVQMQRLVGAGGQERGLGQQLDLQRQQVAEDARQRDDHVDARPAQLLQRQQLGAGQATVAVEARLGADEGQRLRDRRAFGLQVVGAPQHQRDAFREGMAVGVVALQQPFGLARAVLHRIGAGDAEGVETVQVAAGGQDGRRAQQVAARRRAHEAAVQRVHQAGDFVVLGQQRVDPGQFARTASAMSRRPACRPWPALRRAPGRRPALRPRHVRAAGRARLRPPTAAGRHARAGSAPCRRRAGRAGSACIRVRAPPRSARRSSCRRHRPRPVRPRPVPARPPASGPSPPVRRARPASGSRPR